MKISNKALITTIIFLLGYVFVYSQGSYDWNEHNDAMEDISWKSVGFGLLVILCIVGLIKLLSNIPPKKASKKKSNDNTILPKRDEYIGEKKDGKKHGIGKMTYANGDEYEGAWENDEKHGYGTEKNTDQLGFKSITKGNWKNGKICGQYEYTVDNNVSFNGENFEFNGSYEVIEVWNSYTKKMEKCRSYVERKGRWVYSDMILEGEIRLVERFGVFSQRFFGKITYTTNTFYGDASEGDIYEGEADQAGGYKRDGIGKMTYANGEICQGKWCENKKDESLS